MLDPEHWASVWQEPAIGPGGQGFGSVGGHLPGGAGGPGFGLEGKVLMHCLWHPVLQHLLLGGQSEFPSHSFLGLTSGHSMDKA